MHVLVHVHHHFSLPFFFAPVDEREKKKSGRERRRKKTMSYVVFAIFLRFFFSYSFYVHSFLSDQFFLLSLSLCLPYLFLKVLRCINIRFFIIILLTANNTPMVWLLISFFFWFRRLLNRTFFFSFDLSIARD
jgi:hypothetical protein